jgi:hypothetical protein
MRTGYSFRIVHPILQKWSHVAKHYNSPPGEEIALYEDIMRVEDGFSVGTSSSP